METRQRNLTVREDVEKAEGNAKIVKAAVVVVAATIETTNAKKRVQIQKTSVLHMVEISGASATRILEETIMILQEEVTEMDKDVVTPILAVVTVVQEVADAVATTTMTTTIMVTTMATNITTWMVHCNKELQMLVKEPIKSTMLNTII
jgi:hypothetical protein